MSSIYGSSSGYCSKILDRIVLCTDDFTFDFAPGVMLFMFLADGAGLRIICDETVLFLEHAGGGLMGAKGVLTFEGEYPAIEVARVEGQWQCALE